MLKQLWKFHSWCDTLDESQSFYLVMLIGVIYTASVYLGYYYFDGIVLMGGGMISVSLLTLSRIYYVSCKKTLN